jgi:hypothetical protein
MSQDEQYLDLLSIFHYVLGGLTALFSCFPFIHLAIGIALLSGDFDGKKPPPEFFAWLFVLIPGTFILMGWTLSIFIFITGRKLKRRVSWIFCLTVAAVECLLIPFGTILGVFTLIVLMKDPVKALFMANQQSL